MTYNQFDIMSAHYHFCRCWRQGDYNQAIAPGDIRVKMLVLKWDAQLFRLKYRPGLSDSKLSTMQPNAKAIYMRLVKTHLGVKHGR
jgi:hypothetical protein